MTANVGRTPNHFHFHNDVTIGGRFGHIHSVVPVGFGDQPHITIRFAYGLTLELDPTDAAQLLLSLPKAIGRLGNTPNLAGAVWSDFPLCDCPAHLAADLDDHYPNCTARRPA